MPKLESHEMSPETAELEEKKEGFKNRLQSLADSVGSLKLHLLAPDYREEKLRSVDGKIKILEDEFAG